MWKLGFVTKSDTLLVVLAAVVSANVVGVVVITKLLLENVVAVVPWNALLLLRSL